MRGHRTLAGCQHGGEDPLLARDGGAEHARHVAVHALERALPAELAIPPASIGTALPSGVEGDETEVRPSETVDATRFHVGLWDIENARSETRFRAPTSEIDQRGSGRMAPRSRSIGS
jgi:hypothetical protein